MLYQTVQNELELLPFQVKQYRMFHDDSMRSFFRRLSFTPDGSFLLAPGKHKACFLLVKSRVLTVQHFFSNFASLLSASLKPQLDAWR